MNKGNLKAISALIGSELEQVEKELSFCVSSDLDILHEIFPRTLLCGGKRIRPILVLLASKLCGYNGIDSVKLAAVIEKIHTASLMHDDVIDSASFRRGNRTVNKQYGNSIAVLCGDYLYTNAFISAIDMDSGGRILRLLTGTVRDMSEAELFQLGKLGSFDITLDDYYRIVYGKTSALFSAACACGAMLGLRDEDKINALSDFGCNLGYAFQLRDDILDYFGDKEKTGKQIGKDLSECKVTLPILLLSRCAKNKTEELFFSSMNEKEKLNAVMGLFNEYNILEESLKIIDSFIDKACLCLDIFEDSIYKNAVRELASVLRYRSS